MKCPYCSYSETKVIDSRETPNLESTRRRRECLHCKKRFTTYERVEMIELNVIKKDGRREPFDRNKLRAGIIKSCEKRPVSSEQIEKIVDEIEKQIRKKDTTEVSTRVIGDLVMRKLRSVDKVAYIRFASVYKSFDDLMAFEKELRELGHGKKEKKRK
jgi:transcriptional repressor NrdR